ncbi:MAG: hypothetical protein Kow0037_07560 [Calditrichia bacterium]
MKTKTLSLILLILPLLLQAQDLKTGLLGGTDLVTRHSQNSLDLYRFTGNSAFLMQSEIQNYTQIYLNGGHGLGDFHREYDPRSQRDYQTHVEGIKHLSSRQAFWGRVDYDIQKWQDRPYALELNPYNDDPIMTADTTVGNFSTHGPEVTTRYQLQLNQKLGLGAKINYQILQSIKDRYVRGRILRRNFAAQIAVVYQLLPNLHVGSYFEYRDLQDELEMKRSEVDGVDPLVKRFRSELVFWQTSGNPIQHVDRYYDSHLNVAVQHASPSGRFVQILAADYIYHHANAFDKKSKKYYDSDWYADDYRFAYENRLTSWRNGMDAGIRLTGRYQKSYSQHPSLPILITERRLNEFTVAIGLSRLFHTGKNPFTLYFQPELQWLKDDYQDYQSKIDREVKNSYWKLKLAGEWKVSPIHRLLGGWQFGKFKRSDYSPRYLPDYQNFAFSLGISEERESFNYLLGLRFSLMEEADSSRQFSVYQISFSTRILN